MDIFTTQLTRVVPITVKPAQLKVKALVKEAAASKLSDDPDHLENHDYYFSEIDAKKNDEQQNKESDKQENSKKAKGSVIDETTKATKANKKEHKSEDENDDDVHHLDIYV